MLTFLEAVLDLDDGAYVKAAMLDCIADARIAGVENWFSKLSGLLAHVNGGVVPADALHPDGAVNVEECLGLWRRYHHSTVWGNLAVDPRTAPSKGVALVTYNAWFSSSARNVHSVHGTGASAGGPEADLGDVHWRPAPCITADNIPHNHLISLIKLRTNSHGLNIEMLRHTRPRVPRASRTCPWCHTPGALHDELHCVLECPHIAHVRRRYPILFGSGVGTHVDMRTLFTDETLVAPLASFVHNMMETSVDEQHGIAST